MENGEWRLTLFKTSRKRNAITQESAKLNDGVTKEEKLGICLNRWHDVETLGCTRAGVQPNVREVGWAR
jgi:hypothetical protein